MNEKRKTFLVDFAYICCLGLIAWLAVRYLLRWLLPFVLAVALATLAEPVIEFARRHLRWKRSFTAALVTLVLLIGSVTLLSSLVIRLVNEATDLLNQLPEYLSSLPDFAHDISKRLEQFCSACPAGIRSWMDEALPTLSDRLTEEIGRLSSQLVKSVAAQVTKLPRFALFCGTTALAVFFTLSAFPDIMAFLRRQLSFRRLQQVRGIKKGILVTLGRWLRAQCILLGITFALLLLAFLVLRQPYTLLLSLLIALIDALPVFGVGTVLLPWALACFLGENVPKAIALLALYGLITVVHHITEPKVLSSQAGLPSIVSLLAMYVGFCISGVTGMIVFPIVAILIKHLHDSQQIHLWK